MDPHYSYVDEERSFDIQADWTEFYGDIGEVKPQRMPETLGIPVDMASIEDADRAGNVVTQRSHTDTVLFVINALIKLFSKRQNMVTTSTFGSEVVELRITRDLTVELAED